MNCEYQNCSEKASIEYGCAEPSLSYCSADFQSHILSSPNLNHTQLASEIPRILKNAFNQILSSISTQKQQIQEKAEEIINKVQNQTAQALNYLEDSQNLCKLILKSLLQRKDLTQIKCVESILGMSEKELKKTTRKWKSPVITSNSIRVEKILDGLYKINTELSMQPLEIPIQSTTLSHKKTKKKPQEETKLEENPKTPKPKQPKNSTYLCYLLGKEKLLKKLSLNNYSFETVELNHLPADIFDYGAQCRIPSNLCFFYGGMTNAAQHSASCFTVNLETNETELLPDLIPARCFAGAVFHKDFVYVFGGYNGAALNLASKLSIQSKQWFSMNHLPVPVRNATVVVHNDQIYIAGMCKEVLRLDPLTQTYTFILSQHSWKVPSLFLEGLLFKINSQVYLLRKKAIYKKAHQESWEFVCHTKLQVSWNVCASPVEFEDKAFFAYGGEAFCFGPQTGLIKVQDLEFKARFK